MQAGPVFVRIRARRIRFPTTCPGPRFVQIGGAEGRVWGVGSAGKQMLLPRSTFGWQDVHSENRRGSVSSRSWCLILQMLGRFPESINFGFWGTGRSGSALCHWFLHTLLAGLGYLPRPKPAIGGTMPPDRLALLQSALAPLRLFARATPWGAMQQPTVARATRVGRRSSAKLSSGTPA